MAMTESDHSEKVLQIKHKINDPFDVITVEKEFEALQKQYQVFDTKIHEMANIAGELCENILKHGKPGTMTIRYHDGATPYIEIISENRGMLPEDAEEDGKTTKNSLGLGLGAVCRMSDVFSHEQDGEILRIRAVKYCEEFARRTEVAALSFPVMAHEQNNGDAIVIHKSKTDLFGVIDALGHGENAYQSAQCVKDYIEKNHFKPLTTLIQEIDELLREKKMRGVVLSLVRIDYDSKLVEFCGVGDTNVKLYMPGTDTPLHALADNGIVGDNYHAHLHPQTFPLVSGAVLAMYTDGVSNKLAFPLSLRHQPLLHSIHQLMGLYARKHDDRTLLLVKIV